MAVPAIGIASTLVGYAQIKHWLRLRRLRRLGRQELGALTGREFELWVGEVFRALGFRVTVTRPAGDHGVDVIARRFRITIVIQCKRWPTTAVGEHVVRQLFGVMVGQRATYAVLVTTGRLTQATRTWAAGKPISLWDGETLRISTGTWSK